MRGRVGTIVVIDVSVAIIRTLVMFGVGAGVFVVGTAVLEIVVVFIDVSVVNVGTVFVVGVFVLCEFPF